MMSRTDRRPAARGFSLVELMFSVVILASLSVLLMRHLTGVYRWHADQKDKVFADEKAEAMLAELRAYVERDDDVSASGLDVFDDGTVWNPVLTTTQKGGAPLAPDHPLSGNTARDGKWLFARRITVKPFAGLANRNVRFVTVRVGRLTAGGEYRPISVVSGVVNSIGEGFPTAQVFDVYLLALENVPGWWVFMDAIRPFVEATITDLEARNPGVKFRTHWITELAYGRDRLYAPALNKTADSTSPIRDVYFYPGRMPAGSASTWYYVPDLFKARVRMDGSLINGYDPAKNPHPYALADRFNHAMRLPEERELFDARVAAGLEDPESPTWRLLLEDMCSQPERYKNAILMNLHGELLPMPPLRNYSDPARSPTAAPGLRVVTHPEKLRFRRGAAVSSSEDVRLRVYAWRRNPAAPGDGFTDGRPITLQILGVDLTKNVNGAGSGPVTLRVERLEGGVDRGDGNVDYRPFAPAPRAAAPGRPREMFFDVSYVDDTASGGEKFTLLKLYNTPSVAPPVLSGGVERGLHPSRRLYGMDYIPCPAEAAADFSTTLASPGRIEKNTARWRITIPSAVLDGAVTGSGLSLADQVLEVRTRIGDDLTSGTAFPVAKDPANLSRTWIYWTASADAVPFTERYQVIGDPRHCPYADLMKAGDNFPNGYNWYFDDFRNGTADGRNRWPAFDAGRLRANWRGRLEVDFPRLAQLLRRALTRSKAVYTTLTGFSYYYLGLGGEIGYDSANGYPASIPVDLTPYGGSGKGFVDNISGGGWASLRRQKLIRAAGGGTYWWGLHWLGELYPDSEAAQWLAHGNLPAGAAAGRFYRVKRSAIAVNLPYGTRLADAQRRTAAEGCTSVFNVGTASSTFHHQYASGTSGSLEGPGLELAQRYNFPLPTTTKISRPFSTAIGFHGGVGDEFPFTADFPRYTAAVERVFYRHSSGRMGSALVRLTSPAGSSARIVVNGLDRTVESGSAFIAKYSVLSLLHAFLEAGNPTLPAPITPPPRVEIVEPTDITELDDPSSIKVIWRTSWRRWDGGKYTGSYPDDYAGDEADLVYRLSYSRDGGKTWRHCQDDSPAVLGVRPASPSLLLDDGGPGEESFDWPVPAARFPEGSYLVRVEAFRRGTNLHFSYHQTKFFLNR